MFNSSSFFRASLSLFALIILIVISVFFVILQFPNVSISVSKNDFTITYSSFEIDDSNNSNLNINSKYGFSWPIVGYARISSYFGTRSSPTAGASSYHSGIDIPAPEGTKLIAIDDAYVYFASWGAGRWIHYFFKSAQLFKYEGFILSCISKFHCKSW